MDNLNEKEWLLINDIIKEIYTAKSFRKLGETFLLLIRRLVPFKTASLAVVKSNSFIVDAEQSILIGESEDEKKAIEDYNEKYSDIDYTNDIFSFPRSTVFRDTDVIDEEQKLNTIFYKEFLSKAEKDYFGGIIIKKEGSPNVCITFFRSKLYGPLKDKELFILELFVGHLENIIQNIASGVTVKPNDYTHLPGYELLSERELEIFPYIIHGYSNSELGEKFGISESTAKKHVYNILLKCNAGSRGELIKMCFESSL